MVRAKRTESLPPLLQAAIIATISSLALGSNTTFNAPPRFDGAGYALLAMSLSSGAGYRELDHPARPPHAHFPPGYPLMLAALWKVTGVSVFAAHTFSFLCVVGATLVAWLWFRGLFSRRVAFVLGMALACNWRWARDGGAILSEPLFLLISQLAIWWAVSTAQDGGWWRCLVLGCLLGAATLTRHVGICLAATIICDLALRRRWASAFRVFLTVVACLVPWVVRLIGIRKNTQIWLWIQAGLARRVIQNAWFYFQRIPDQIVGPVVEVGTTFRPAFWIIAIGWACLVTPFVVWGCLRALRRTRWRIAGAYPVFTLVLLITWPFTEAGRFLIPLLPCLLVGILLGQGLISRHRPQAREWQALVVLLVSLPYPVYAIVTGRAEAAQRTHSDFDEACGWLKEHARRPALILARHPGEVFWQTGIHALNPPGDNSPGSIQELVRHYGVIYVLVDDERYTGAQGSALDQFVITNQAALRLVWRGGGSRPSRVYVIETAAVISASDLRR